MNKTPKQHIDLLEFTCKKIYGESSGWWSLDLIAYEYNKITSNNLNIDDIRHIAALYKNKIFQTSTKSDLQIYPKPEIKQEIENHKSLKKYIKEILSSSEKTNPNNKISRLAKNPIIQIISLIVLIYSFLKIIEALFKIEIPYI